MPTTDIQTVNPATGEPLEEFAFQSDSQVDALLAKAEAAFHIWRAKPVQERAGWLHALAIALRLNKEHLARIMTLEMGKIIAEAEAEVEKCARQADWYAEHGPPMLQNEPTSVTEAEAYVSFLPIGPILAIMPWNFPLWQVLRFGVPAMLAGNVVVLKHAPNVQRSALELECIMREYGFPDGVLQNLLIPTDKVPAIIHDRRIAGVTLTGSPRAGASVAAEAGKAIKKSVLELGGSDAFIVLPDADIDAAVQAGIKARFANAGQVCIAAKRFILTEPIAEEFQAKFVQAARQLRVGDPLQRDVQIGPLARNDLREVLDNQVQATIKAGATLLLGGSKSDGPGFFYRPTVLSHVQPDMIAAQEETFGPVAALVRVRDADEAVDLANRTEYGLSSNLWTRDLDRARQLARRIQAGSVFINAVSASDPRIPIGGIKRSGYGRELSYFGLREFVNVQTVWLAASNQ